MTPFAHSLPIEVWLRVFSLACNDNGATGNAISSVCRYLRNAVKPYRFQSVHLLGGTQIAKFTQLFQRLDSEEKAIRSLVFICPKFVLLPTPPNMTTVGSMYDQAGEVVASSLMDPYVRQLTAQRSASRDYEQGVIGALSRIISGCRSTLESLSVSLDFAIPLPHYDLPHLQNLVLYAPVSSSFFYQSSLPSLHQLRIGPVSMPDAEQLFQACPNIHGLHLHESTMMLPKRLRRILEIFPCLDSVIVEMEDPVICTGRHNDELSYIIREHLIKQLKKIAEDDPRVVLVKGGNKETWMNALWTL